MSKNLSPLRPAMTAIAAVIALSSTPLFAQAVDGSAEPAAPVIVAPPPVAAAPPEVSAVAPVNTAAPAMKMVGTPVIHEADGSATSSTSAAATVRAVHTPVKRVSTAPAARTPAPIAAASVTPTKTDMAPAPSPVVAEKVAVAPPAAVPAAAPPAAPDRTTSVSTTQDETLPIAGGIGLAVIALGGAAYAASRRRRHDRAELPAETAFAAVPVTAAPPVMSASQVAATAAAPVAGARPRTLPSGFDISRFGPYTQAAYLGPTPDNPSHSLKRRLKRASFFDQREREAIAAGRVEQPVAAPAARTASQEDGQVTVRLAPQRKTGVFGYVLQR